MPRTGIRVIFDDYCRAVAWVESIIKKIPDNARMYVYRATLEKEVKDFEGGIELASATPAETNAILEANLESAILIDIHKKFGNRREKEFIDKLKESLFGPPYSNDELTGNPAKGKGKSRTSFGRDIQSELLLATRIIHPEIVSFKGNDIVYDLGTFKFGAEVKRIHSEAQISPRFNEACQQLQDNPEIQFGLVALRFDKFYFPNVEGYELLELAKRENSILRTANEDELANAAGYQTRAFRNKYNNILAQQALRWSKVSGLCAFIYIPCLLGTPSTPYNVGQLIYNFWDIVGPNRESRKSAYTSLIEELPSGAL